MTHMESTLMIYPHGELASSFVSPCHDPMPSWTLTPVLLLAYKGRMDVIMGCQVEDIPFGDTEYCEQATRDYSRRSYRTCNTELDATPIRSAVSLAGCD